MLDDIKEDESPHLYDWLMRTPADLRIVEIKEGVESDGSTRADIVLGEKGDRRLLVRVLECRRSSKAERLGYLEGVVD